MYLASLSSSQIQESNLGNKLVVNTAFDWTEIGDGDIGKDLYVNGFIDVIEGS